jgi:hypothetical protein
MTDHVRRMLDEVKLAQDSGDLHLTQLEGDALEAIKLTYRVGRKLNDDQQRTLLDLWRRANE